MTPSTQLVRQVEAMVHESGDPTGFDAAAWLTKWLQEPLPALGGCTPSSMMGTTKGRATVAALLAQMQSGAYA